MTTQLNRRTFLRVFRHLIDNGRASFTVAGAGVPPDRKDLKHWKTALKTTLRVARNRLGIDYALLYEISTKGYQHAHILLTRKNGKDKFTRVRYDDLKMIRDLYVQILCKMRDKKKEPHRGKDEENPEKKMRVNPKKVFYVCKTYKGIDGKKYPASGKTSGFIDYLLKKPETVEKGTTLSSGLIKLRVGGKKIEDI